MYRILLSFTILVFSSFELIDCTRVIADEQFLQECLFAHNKYRDLHEGTPRLRTNRTATEYAVNRVMALAKMDGHRMPVDKRVVYGENFYWYYDTQGFHNCKDAVDVWYNGITKYNYNRPGFSDSTGGFSQVVWKGSQYVGCALVEHDRNSNYPETFIVCNYWPAGNIDNQYPYHVLPVKDKERPPPPPVPGTGTQGGGNEWSGDRPGQGGGQRPGTGNRPDPPTSGGNRPGGGGQWNGDRPGSGSGDQAGIWTVPPRPSGGHSRPKPPSPPPYPLNLLHPMI